MEALVRETGGAQRELTTGWRLTLASPISRHLGYSLLLALVLLGMSAWAARAQTGLWVVLGTMRVPQQEGAVEALDGRIYSAAGFAGLVTEASSFVQAYDVATDTWSQVPSLPEALHHPASAVLDGKFYVLGGFYGGFAQREPAQSVWAYDPATDEWTRRASLPTARGALAAVTLEGRVYAIGGERRGPSGGAADYESVADVAVYDPAADRWDPLPPLQHARNHLGAAAIGGRIYAVGGRDGSSWLLSYLEEYDPATRTWRERAPLPTGRSGHATAALNGRLYVFGGEGNSASPRGVFAEVEAYDPIADAWALADTMPTPRHGFSAVTVGERIYLPGGSTRQGGFGYGRTTLLDTYTPD